MNVRFERLSLEHRMPVIDLFNDFIEKSFAAFPDRKVGYEFFDVILHQTRNYPAVAMRHSSGDVVGFAFLRAYHADATFTRTAEISYFIKPEYTRQGTGTAVLAYFAEEAKKRDIESFLASVSSLNEASVNFHRKNGFAECGRLRKIGKKFGQDFDVLWMQKFL